MTTEGDPEAQRRAAEEEIRKRQARERQIEDDEKNADDNVGVIEKKGRHEAGEKTRYRPLDALQEYDLAIEDDRNPESLDKKDRLRIRRELQNVILGPFLNLSQELNFAVEATAGKKDSYSAQHALERQSGIVAQTEEMIASVYRNEETDEPSETNKVVLGAVMKDQLVNKSMMTIYTWANPYLAMYWAGMDSLRLIMERGMQLPMADLQRLFKGPQIKWVEDGLKKINEKAKKVIPLLKAKKEKGVEPEEGKKETETFGERMAKYTADTYFFTQVRGEMVTFNPTYGIAGFTRAQSEGRPAGTNGPDDKGQSPTSKEQLNISETMQMFVHSLSNLKDRLNTAPIDPNDSEAMQKQGLMDKTYIYYDDLGNQIPESQATENSRKVGLYVNTLDYFNNMKSDEDRRWIIATTAAMAECGAKDVLDGMSQDVWKAQDFEETTKYIELFNKVKQMSIEIYNNFDGLTDEHKMAKTAFDLSYSIAFGSFSVADWGWKYEWEKGSNGLWKYEGSQGDPTASGDAFTARRPYFHEVVYWAVKNRMAAMGSGVMVPSQGGEEGLKLAHTLLSEMEEINQRGVMLEKIKKGEQPQLARYFGVLGCFEADFAALDKNSAAYKAWAKGAEIRKTAGKTANPNLIKTIEESLVFIKTPFKDVVYPMVMPQFQISLMDMIRDPYAAKDSPSAGDLLRGTWKKVDGKFVPATLAEGGRRLTMRDIDWTKYGAYADDSRAVNNNFMSQIYGPLYGAANSKNIEGLEASPMAGLTGIIKAVDIATRNYVKRLKGGDITKRQSFETIYASGVMFQNLAFGVHSIIGRGAIGRFKGFIGEVIPATGRERSPNNMYSVLRAAEDFLNNKQNYANYADGYYLMMLAQAEAVKPIVVASEMMARATTNRMVQNDALQRTEWNNVVEVEKKVTDVSQVSNLQQFVK